MKMEFKSFRTKEELMAYISDEVTAEYAPFGLVMHEMGEVAEEAMSPEEGAAPETMAPATMAPEAATEEYYPPEEMY